MSFSSNKAPGFDKVTMSVIKDALPCILPVLTDIVNRSLLPSVFPAAWKISEVIPLPKDGDHEIPNNNRPVWLLPAASKICERVALNQLMTYMTNKKRLSQHQSGNKKLHFCETLNVMITEQLPRLPADFHVILLGRKVTPSPSARDLGLQVDSTLSYDKHVSQTVSLCIGSLCQINRVKHLFDVKTLERVINALVLSKLYYCSPVWSNTSKENISKLQKVQNFAGRIITGKRKFDHITPVLRELRLLPVISFLKYMIGVLAFKCVKGLAPSYLCNTFKIRACVHDRNTRYKNNLNIPAYKSASGQRTFLYRATSFWNSLPREITESDSLPTFKRHLKEFLHSF